MVVDLVHGLLLRRSIGENFRSKILGNVSEKARLEFHQKHTWRILLRNVTDHLFKEVKAVKPKESTKDLKDLIILIAQHSSESERNSAAVSQITSSRAWPVFYVPKLMGCNWTEMQPGTIVCLLSGMTKTGAQSNPICNLFSYVMRKIELSTHPVMVFRQIRGLTVVIHHR